MKELAIDSQAEKLDEVLDFLNAELAAHEVAVKIRRQIAVAAEEIYVNIAHYAYGPEIGKAIVRVDASGDNIIIEFEDGGRMYNPLEHEDPDTTRPADERELGGLGILMAKKMTDGISYRREGGKNILTVKKARQSK
jgi:anti-sigma regulatory factor (Ser/Thr protein kinase)